MAARGLLRKTLFPPSLVSCLRYQLFLVSKTSILQAIPKENIPLNRCAGTKIVMLMLRSTAPAINLKNSWKKTTLQAFFVLCTWLVSPPRVYGTLLFPLMLLTTTAKKTTLFADYSRLFVWNCGLYWSADPLHACARGDLAKSRF